jgi:fucose 4-O-acetylase-like acetyltransferase
LERRPTQSVCQFLMRIGNLALLYLIWNLINAVPAILFSRYINRGFGQSGLWDALNPLHVNGIMWFFVALIFSQTFYYLTRPWPLSRWVLILISVIVLAVDQDVHGIAYGTLWLLTGAEATRLNIAERCKSDLKIAGASVTLYGIFTAACYQLNVPYTLAIPACGAAIVSLWTIVENLPEERSLIFIGQNTLSIYVMHIIAEAGLRIGLINFIHMTPSGAMIPALTLSGVALPLAAIMILRYFHLSRALRLD